MKDNLTIDILFRVAATAFSIDSILQSSSSPSSSSTSVSSSSPLTPLTSSPLFSGLSSPLLAPFPHFPASFSCLPPFLPPPDSLLPPLIPKHLALKERQEESEPRPPLSLFPGVYGGYPGPEGGGPGGMLSQVSHQPKEN